MDVENLATSDPNAPRSRPIFHVEILVHCGAGIIDTAPKQSVAGHMLYDILKRENQILQEGEIFVKLADGSGKTEKVLITHQNVTLRGRTIKTKFIIFPEATNFTLFGIDFLQDAQVLLNLGKGNWSFTDSPDTKFPLSYELPLPSTEVVQLYCLQNLRPEEGTTLTVSQRNVLNAVLQKDEDIFKVGGELRTLDEVTHDDKAIVKTPYLQKMTSTWQDARSMSERQQDHQKVYADLRTRETDPFSIGDRVWVSTHTPSSSAKGVTNKFHPKRDGPYEILRVVSPVNCEICNPKEPTVALGIYHVSALTLVRGHVVEDPLVGLRKRGRPRKKKRPSRL